MNAATEKTLRELALETPAASRVFEKLHLDYCCGGGQTLRQACDQAHVPVEQVLSFLEETSYAAQDAVPGRDWRTESLSALMAHIRSTHHRYTRDEIARLGPLFEKVCSVHGERHPELRKLRRIFDGLSQELTSHLMKEEMVLFPYIEQMEAAVASHRPVQPPPFGTVSNPVAMMLHEHDDAGQALRDLRSASKGFTAPADACISFQTLYRALAEFEADLHQHIHLENNILFPRAVEMEAGRG